MLRGRVQLFHYRKRSIENFGIFVLRLGSAFPSDFFYEKVRIFDDKFVSVRAHATYFRFFVVAQTTEQADLQSTPR